MTAELQVRQEPVGEVEITEQAAALVEQVRRLLSAATTPEQAKDVHARVQAARAWAKAYRQLKDVRLSLLRAEMDCLVRCWQLGGGHLLTEKERAAAKWFAGIAPDLRPSVLEEGGAVTTAVGMHAWFIRRDWSEAERETSRRQGRRDGAKPDRPRGKNTLDGASLSVVAVLRELLDGWVQVGVPIEIDAVAEDLLVAAHSVGADEEYLAGVREVVRQAVESTEPERINGTVIPRMITVRVAEGGYLRVPTQSATVAHLDDWLALTREQADRAAEAFRRATEFVARIRRLSTDPDARVGDVIEKSVRQASDG